MNSYSAILKDFLVKHPPNYGYADANSLLEHLWHSYTEFNPINNDATKASFLTLEPVFDSLSIAHANFLFTVVCNLCEEYERQAFLDGIHVGVRLVSELWQKQMTLHRSERHLFFACSCEINCCLVK